MQSEIDFSDAKFFGDGYDPKQDSERLKGQLKAVYDCMTSDRAVTWWTLAGISGKTGVPEASASAAIRSLRNQYGFIITRKRAREGYGLNIYRIEGRDESLAKKKKKMKPVGDPELWGNMMRGVYAYSADSSSINQDDAIFLFKVWMEDMKNRINNKEIEV